MKPFQFSNIDLGKISALNKLIVPELFSKSIEAARKINFTPTKKPQSIDQVFPPLNSENSKCWRVEKELNYELDPAIGSEFAQDILFSGYDESKINFMTLEGEAYLTTHVLTHFTPQDVIPTSQISFYFYTHSKLVKEVSETIKYSEDINSSANLDYVTDRNSLIESNSLSNSLMFIDGPLIGGNITAHNLKLVESLHRKSILPIFFVKNSDSNIVVDNDPNLKEKYNSDLHWAYANLKRGQRSGLYCYQDNYNVKFTKYFCYFKPFDRVSPQRIEFLPGTYELFSDYFDDIFNLIYYLLLDHGDQSNPQIRPIAISEMYARELIKLININALLKNSTLIGTMNQVRFGD